MNIGLYVKIKFFLSDFNETSVLSTYFLKTLKHKFHDYPSSGSRAVPSGKR